MSIKFKFHIVGSDDNFVIQPDLLCSDCVKNGSVLPNATSNCRRLKQTFEIAIDQCGIFVQFFCYFWVGMCTKFEGEAWGLGTFL